MKGFTPTEAGPLMKELVGHFVLQQFYCPSCGALLDTALEETQEKPMKRNSRGGLSRKSENVRRVRT